MVENSIILTHGRLARGMVELIPDGERDESTCCG